jgi:CDP-glucose 4,6-dehydratase
METASGSVEDMGMNAGFWHGRRVFLTGHTGFKGSWMVAMLHTFGAEVTGFSLAPPTDPNMFDLIEAKSMCRDLRGDIRNQAALAEAIDASKPEIVLHFAAQPLVRASYATPVETYATNVMGTVHLLDACRTTPGIRSIVVVTTDKCYENNGWVWGYRENDRLGGADPYSNSKAACELVVDSYRRSFFASAIDKEGTHVASARAGNVIGGGDFALDRLIPDAIRAFMAAETLPIRNPHAIRPWQHVLEPLAGYLLLAERLYRSSAAAESWNFGPRTEESASVEAVVDIVAKYWGRNATWSQDTGYHPHEAATLKLDSTKARIELGWHPKLTLEKSIQMTTEWYLGFLRGDNLRALTLSQIKAYQEQCVA